MKVGERAPDFTLTDQDKNEINLTKDLLSKGGDVVLTFYPFDFSPVCTTEMQCFTGDIAKFEQKGATVVGISCDSFFAHKAWADTLGLKTTLLADMHREVCKAYGFYFPPLNCAARGTVVIGPDGVVKWVNARELKDAVKNDELLAAIS
ncbi:MAG: peroxiredoxin [Phycisphaerales bacterium]|nr:MAG: peroxiredoxin [Phycisphaerales bacterium]